MHCCYILKNKENDTTYVGYTTNPQRRLRQHNAELSGGARSTCGRQWFFIAIVTGFTDNKTAMSYEWKIKYPTGNKNRPAKYCGSQGRIFSLNEVLQKAVDVDNFTVHVLSCYGQYLDRQKLQNINIVEHNDAIYLE